MPGQNNDRAVRVFREQQINILQTVFNKRSYFARAMRKLQVNGIENNEYAFRLKVNNQQLAFTTYNTGPNVGFGTGTSNSSRFGNRTEIKYTTLDVPFQWTNALDVGIDEFTVNNDMATAMADIKEKLAILEMRFADRKIAEELVASAGKNFVEPLQDPERVIKAVEKARQHLVNVEAVTAGRIMFLTPDIYGLIADATQSTTAKNASIDVKSARMVEVTRGFDLIEVPEDFMPVGVKIIATIEEITTPFIGIETSRVLPTVEAHTGAAVQYASKGGIYTLEDNKKAIVTVASL